MKKLVRQLKELQSFNIELSGDIDKILDNPKEWAEKVAEDSIRTHLELYVKAKKLGVQFANELKD